MRTKTPTRKGRILKVEIITRSDDSPDTSDLGEYTDKAGEGVIVCATGEFYLDIERRTRIINRAFELAEIAGEFGDTAKETYWGTKAQRLADRWESQNEIPERSRDYRFFLPYAGGESVGSKDWRTYARQDWERMREYSKGCWQYIGIMAQAEVTLAGSDVVQRITSGGLWGVESDSGAYLEEVAGEELESLRDELETLGFGPRAIDAAFKTVENVEK